MAQQDYFGLDKWTCIACGLNRASVSNNRFHLCGVCLEKVPTHIPKEQKVRFAKAIERRIRNEQTL